MNVPPTVAIGGSDQTVKGITGEFFLNRDSFQPVDPFRSKALFSNGIDRRPIFLL